MRFYARDMSKKVGLVIGGVSVVLIATVVIVAKFKHHQWGDVATWVAAVATVLAFAAAAIAAMAAFDQLRMLKEQAMTDRDEADKRAERNDELREVEARKQAEQVDVEPNTRPVDLSGAPEPEMVLTLYVENNSSRPIRQVECRAILNGQACPATSTAHFEDSIGGGRAVDQSDVIPVQLMRRSTNLEFIVPWAAEAHPNATYRLRFTDDAGLHWELTDDMHLTRIADRADW